ncbi:MAG: DMT family transporter [Pseudomonadota bacterium]
MQITNAAWAMLFALSVLWGGAFFFVEVAVAVLPPFVVVWLRVALAALALFAFCWATGRRMPGTREAWVALAVMGLLNNVIPFSLITWGQTEIESGLASIINAMTPVSAVLLAHFFTEDEKLTGARAAGVGLGILGVTVLIGWDVLAGLGGAVLGQLAVLAATISYGFSSLWGRRFRAIGLDPVVTATGQVTCSSILLLPALLLSQPWTLPFPGWDVVGSLIGLAVLATALAYILFFRILAIAGAGNVMLVTLLIPPSAILLGWAILGERLGPQHFAGFAIIGLGLLFLDGRVLAAMRQRST